MSYPHALLPLSAAIAPTLPGGGQRLVMVPQQVVGLPHGTLSANKGSGARAHGLADPQQPVHAAKSSSWPWESASPGHTHPATGTNPAEVVYVRGPSICSPTAWGHNSVHPLQGGVLASPTPSEFDSDFFLPRSSGMTTSEPLDRPHASQAMMKGEPRDHDEYMRRLVVDYPFDESAGPVRKLPEPLPSSSLLGYTSSAIPLGLLPSVFQSDGTVLTPQAHGQKAGAQSSQMLWPMHDGEAYAYCVTAGAGLWQFPQGYVDRSGPVYGSSLKDMWTDESPLGSLRFSTPPP
jgi:hypothetical protein